MTITVYEVGPRDGLQNEAARIDTKHLMTLQEGVSIDQHKEMEEEGIVLVVPRKLLKSYPEEVQAKTPASRSNTNTQNTHDGDAAYDRYVSRIANAWR